jgi:exodeoxyribonuclease V gamma subunit
MGIHVIQSQSLEVLLQGVMASITQPSSSPFQVFKTQHFIVPSPAQEQWLTQKIAEQQGMTANYQFHQRIRGFQWYAYQQVLENKEQVRKANIPRLILKWRIHQALQPFIQSEQNTLHKNTLYIRLCNGFTTVPINCNKALKNNLKTKYAVLGGGASFATV